jgi:hypothetical protein
MELMDRDERPSAGYVRVTNMNDKMYPDAHNGIVYQFEPGKPINIPAEVAQHIFGWNPSLDGPDPDYMTKRCGRNTKALMESGEGLAWVNNFLVEGVKTAVIEVPEGMTQEDMQEAVRLAASAPPDLPEA